MKTSIREMKDEIQAMETTAIESAIQIMKNSDVALSAEEIAFKVALDVGIGISAEQLRANFANAGRTTNSRKKCNRQENNFKPVYTSRFEAIGKLKLNKEVEEKRRVFMEVDDKGEIVQNAQSVVKTEKVTKYSVK